MACSSTSHRDYVYQVSFGWLKNYERNLRPTISPTTRPSAQPSQFISSGYTYMIRTTITDIGTPTDTWHKQQSTRGPCWPLFHSYKILFYTQKYSTLILHLHKWMNFFPSCNSNPLFELNFNCYCHMSLFYKLMSYFTVLLVNVIFHCFTS